jgi:hypothetical protein
MLILYEYYTCTVLFVHDKIGVLPPVLHIRRSRRTDDGPSYASAVLSWTGRGTDEDIMRLIDNKMAAFAQGKMTQTGDVVVFLVDHFLD